LDLVGLVKEVLDLVVDLVGLAVVVVVSQLTNILI
jgi:hypothetical protein